MHFCIEVSGDFACFTRPEMKVERVSYDVITPSATRAIFEAILWKPAIMWHVDKIEVLEDIRWISIKRNEVGKKMSARNAQSLMNGTLKDDAIYIDTERQQRTSLLLSNVRYRLYAHFEMTEKAGKDDNKNKFIEMFIRRANKGQCIYQPYLGCREFSCDFRFINDADIHQELEPKDITQDLGFMLYDMDFSDIDNPKALFFRAKLEKGVLHVPNRNSSEVLR